MGDLLDRHLGLRTRPSPAGVVRLEGRVHFCAAPPGGEEIEDTYDLRIDVPRAFPDSVPIVTELGGRIPRDDPDAHVFTNGSLCLGSPLRLVLIAKGTPSVLAFFDRCIVSALYNASHREQYGGRVPLGELAHGVAGELDDYKDLFGVQTYRQVLAALDLACKPRRSADLRPCPCGCPGRLGSCPTNNSVRSVRELVGRAEVRRFTAGLRRRLRT